MSDNTAIEWTDATWNPVVGCSVLSPGCINCYAMKLAGTRLKHTPSRQGLTVDSKAGPVWNGEVRFMESWLDQPLRWKRPRKIFVCAHGDLFHEDVPVEWIDRVFAVMALAPRHTFQVLTKRAEKMRAYCTDPNTPGRIWEQVCQMVDQWHEGKLKVMLQCLDGDPVLFALGAHGANWGAEQPWPLKNVWAGVSAEDQRRADERIPHLLATPAATRFISAEPLLGPLDLRNYLEGEEEHGVDMSRDPGSKVGACIGWRPPLDWVIFGGESGANARPMHPSWARSLRDQCQAAGVPFFFKQWGEWSPGSSLSIEERLGKEEATVLPDGRVREWQSDYPGARLVAPKMATLHRVGKKVAGALLDGREWREFPVSRETADAGGEP